MTDEQRLLAIQKLDIPGGTINLAGLDATPQVTNAKGETADNLPPRTVVKITLSPAKGSLSNVEIWLPEPAKWNGRFLGLGNGGGAGSINPLIFAGPIKAGYAVATTDMGTSHSGTNNPEVWKDFGYRATHLMTTAAKQVVEAYYGKAPDYSYFSGRSTGGQQALQEAQRYPGDYDGIVAGVPAHCRTPLHAYFLWNAQILAQCPFTESQEKNIIAAGIEHMASREVPAIAGLAVSDPRCTKEDIEAVIKLAMQKDPTLTAQHAEALRKLFGGPVSDSGERLFNGVPFGSSFSQASGHLYLFHWVFGDIQNLMELNFGKDIDTYTAALGPYLNAENPDLGAFQNHGGKLLMFSGAADPIVPYHATLDYYERAAAASGGMGKIQSFFKYYLIPGMDHGSGPVINNLPDMLQLVIDWREKGIEPGMIHGKRMIDGKADIDIPIYPYPLKTTWNASTGQYQPVEGSRGGVEHIAGRFLPPAAGE